MIARDERRLNDYLAAVDRLAAEYDATVRRQENETDFAFPERLDGPSAETRAKRFARALETLWLSYKW